MGDHDVLNRDHEKEIKRDTRHRGQLSVADCGSRQDHRDSLSREREMLIAAGKTYEQQRALPRIELFQEAQKSAEPDCRAPLTTGRAGTAADTPAPKAGETPNHPVPNTSDNGQAGHSGTDAGQAGHSATNTSPPEHWTVPSNSDTKPGGSEPPHDLPPRSSDAPVPRPNNDVTRRLERDYGVTVERNGDKFVYKLPNRNDLPILETNATDADLNRMPERLDRVIKAKTEQMEKAYNVHFVPADTTLTAGDKKFETRQPRLDELFAIEEGLKKSQPATTTGKTVDIVLTKEHVWGYGASYNRDFNGKPTLIMETPPSETPPHGLLESDAEKNNKDMYGHTLEAFIEHELGHHTQHKLGFDDDKQDSMAREMGWEPLKTSEGKEWAVRGNNGELYRPEKDPEGTRVQQWYRCDSNGNPLGADGKPSDMSHAQHVKNDDINALSAVRQTAPYPNPAEMQADGFKFYRMDDKRRQMLLQCDPNFYKSIKDWDQKELDNAYGAGVKIRLPNGEIADSNCTNKEIVTRFELEALKMATEEKH